MTIQLGPNAYLAPPKSTPSLSVKTDPVASGKDKSQLEIKTSIPSAAVSASAKLQTPSTMLATLVKTEVKSAATEMELPTGAELDQLTTLYGNAPSYDLSKRCNKQFGIILDRFAAWGEKHNCKFDPTDFKKYFRDKKLGQNSETLRKENFYPRIKRHFEKICKLLEDNPYLSEPQKINIYEGLINQLYMCGPGLWVTIRTAHQQLNAAVGVSHWLAKQREQEVHKIANEVNAWLFPPDVGRAVAAAMQVHVYETCFQYAQSKNYNLPSSDNLAIKDAHKVDLNEYRQKFIDTRFRAAYTPDSIVSYVINEFSNHVYEEIARFDREAQQALSQKNVSEYSYGRFNDRLAAAFRLITDIPSDVPRLFQQMIVDSGDDQNEKDAQQSKENLDKKAASLESKITAPIPITLCDAALKVIPQSKFEQLMRPYIVRYLMQQGYLASNEPQIIPLSNGARLLRSHDGLSEYSWVETIVTKGEPGQLQSYREYLESNPSRLIMPFAIRIFSGDIDPLEQREIIHSDFNNEIEIGWKKLLDEQILSLLKVLDLCRKSLKLKPTDEIQKIQADQKTIDIAASSRKSLLDEHDSNAKSHDDGFVVLMSFSNFVIDKLQRWFGNERKDLWKTLAAFPIWLIAWAIDIVVFPPKAVAWVLYMLWQGFYHIFLFVMDQMFAPLLKTLPFPSWVVLIISGIISFISGLVGSIFFTLFAGTGGVGFFGVAPLLAPPLMILIIKTRSSEYSALKSEQNKSNEERSRLQKALNTEMKKQDGLLQTHIIAPVKAAVDAIEQLRNVSYRSGDLKSTVVKIKEQVRLLKINAPLCNEPAECEGLIVKLNDTIISLYERASSYASQITIHCNQETQFLSFLEAESKSDCCICAPSEEKRKNPTTSSSGEVKAEKTATATVASAAPPPSSPLPSASPVSAAPAISPAQAMAARGTATFVSGSAGDSPVIKLNNVVEPPALPERPANQHSPS